MDRRKIDHVEPHRIDGGQAADHVVERAVSGGIAALGAGEQLVPACKAGGLAFRVVGGANYFFFDWLGVGGQIGYSLGGLNYDSTFKGSHTYAVLDFGGGLVFQF